MTSAALLPLEEERQCVICEDEFLLPEVEPIRCGHFVCYECLIPMFEYSLRANGIFPTRCCGPPLRLTLRVLQTLPGDMIRRYNDKKEEMDADEFEEKRTYCHVPRCSTFLKRRYYIGNGAACPQCAALTCIICKEKYHDHGVCKQKGGLRVSEVEDLAEAEGWKRCRSCRQMIERLEGCAVIRCFCGAMLCYICGDRPDECKCSFRRGV
ncbi:hypothetical protein INS49_003097 [Diaporthe citri]|uniref:uncharacterized protein n=1 Tax=Diaporthe citri TaxID=83186 RepID=UPI001C81D29E|nr:uncharacterized protein INS49_003097 [Diaporthe citri]KAG6368879.1 hypothetical protein INS49_003097 [Diaporthe citri]